MSEPWQPMDLCTCVGSPFLGWLTGVLAFGMLIWYALIAWRCLDASQHASQNGKRVWQAMVAIFVVCAMAGYGSWVIALWWPEAAVLLSIAMLASQNIICPVFLYYARGRRFATIGVYEGLGEKLAIAIVSTDQLNDRELASLARQIVAKSLERISG